MKQQHGQLGVSNAATLGSLCQLYKERLLGSLTFWGLFASSARSPLINTLACLHRAAS